MFRFIITTLMAISFFAFGCRWIASDGQVPLYGRILFDAVNGLFCLLVVVASAYMMRFDDDNGK